MPLSHPGSHFRKLVMRARFIVHGVALLVNLAISTTSSGFSTRSTSWSEETLLHDGRMIIVERKVDSTFQFLAGDGGSLKLFASWPDKFSLQFKNPDTNETIKWEGEQHINPLLLDFVDGTPYLVLSGQPNKKTQKIYGCPELPYIFLKHEKKDWFGKWIPLSPDKFPKQLIDANLSPDFPYNSENRTLPRAQVIRNLLSEEKRGVIQIKIPRGYDDWFIHDKGKSNRRNDRLLWDCRPPREAPPKVALPTPDEVPLEIVNEQLFAPLWIVTRDEVNSRFYDSAKQQYCQQMTRPTDLSDRWLGERFVGDPSGQKPVPYFTYQYGDLSAARACSEKEIWFVTHLEIPGWMVMTKYTISGDFLYRIKFQKPNQLAGFTGYPDIQSIRSENGYLHFDWIDMENTGGTWKIKRILKAKIKEIDQNIITKPSKINFDEKSQRKLQTEAVSRQSRIGKAFRDCDACPEVIDIPGKNYAIGRYEVTQGEWKAFMGENVHDSKSGPDVGTDKPVVSKNREKIQLFFRELRKKTGKHYRLPTDEEWEHACYAGTNTKYCGSDNMDSVAWFNNQDNNHLQPVGQKQANGFGLYDMSGNAWELMGDSWKGNPDLCVVRGGSYSRHPLEVPQAYIRGLCLDQDIGFRVLRINEPPPQELDKAQFDYRTTPTVPGAIRVTPSAPLTPSACSPNGDAISWTSLEKCDPRKPKTK